MIVLDQGREFPFRRGAGGSIIDLTFAAPRLASRIGNWCVLEVPLSDHRCIDFSIEERCHPVNAGGDGKGKRTSPGIQENSAETSFENISRKPGS